MKTIDVGKDFSIYPAGRYVDDGEFNGETFRKNFLIPALVSNDSVHIVLDNTRGYDSSFLEEVFGGIFREMNVELDSLNSRLILETEDDYLREEIKSYMLDAYKRSKI